MAMAAEMKVEAVEEEKVEAVEEEKVEAVEAVKELLGSDSTVQAFALRQSPAVFRPDLQHLVVGEADLPLLDFRTPFTEVI